MNMLFFYEINFEMCSKQKSSPVTLWTLGVQYYLSRGQNYWLSFSL